jgi:hypothetical protein
MGRRAWANGVLPFIQNFNAGYDTAAKVVQDYELGKIAQEKPEESSSYTPDQVQQLEAAAKSGQYDIGYDQDKLAYTVTPKADRSKVGMIAQQGVTDFLGQRTAGTLTPEQINTARQRAMANVVMRDNPLAGARMLRETDAATREAEAFDMSKQRFGFEKSRAEREERTAAEVEAERGFIKDLDGRVAEWFNKRLVGPDGTARPAGVEDYLAASQYRASQLAGAGKMDAAGRVMKDYAAQSAVQIQLQGAQREQALGQTVAALNAGDLNAVKDFYNKFVPDGARVTDVKRNERGEITIARETLDGRPMPATKLKDANQLTATLASFKDPMAVYQWSQNEFRNTLALRADARAGAAEGRAATADADARRERTDRQAAAVGIADLDAAQQGRPLSSAEREAIRTGVVPARATTKDQPAEVKLAQAAVASGLYPNMAEALKFAVSKKDASPSELFQDLVRDAVKQGGNAKDAVKNATGAMEAAGYSKKGGRWQVAEGGVTGDPWSDPKAIAIRDDDSLTTAQKRAKLKELGYK